MLSAVFAVPGWLTLSSTGNFRGNADDMPPIKGASPTGKQACAIPLEEVLPELKASGQNRYLVD
jgi:hypothetical protein